MCNVSFCLKSIKVYKLPKHWHLNDSWKLPLPTTSTPHLTLTRHHKKPRPIWYYCNCGSITGCCDPWRGGCGVVSPPPFSRRRHQLLCAIWKVAWYCIVVPPLIKYLPLWALERIGLVSVVGGGGGEGVSGPVLQWWMRVGHRS